MSVYAVIDPNGVVVNRILLDDGAAWQPPEGHTTVEETGGGMDIGGTYIDGVYTPPYLAPRIDPELDGVGTGKTANEILGAT